MAKRFSADKLRRARGGRSYEEIAAAVGVSHQTIRNWEAGRGEPTATRIAALAAHLRRPMGWFYEEGAA